MNNKKYTRTSLIQFLQQTLSKNKSNNIYFDLLNNDKLFIDMKVWNGSTKVYLISNSMLRKDIYLWEAYLRDFNWIIYFADYVNNLLWKHNVKNDCFIDNDITFEKEIATINNWFDFDSIKDD